MTSIPWLELNWFDYIIVSIILFSMILSFFRGFVREALSFTIWLGGLFVAFKFAPILQQHIYEATQWTVMSYVIGFGVLFMSVWLAGLLLNLAMRPVVSRVGVGPADRLLGVFFGGLRGLLFVSIAILLLNMSPYREAQAVQSSRLLPRFDGIVHKLDTYVPNKLEKSIHLVMGDY